MSLSLSSPCSSYSSNPSCTYYMCFRPFYPFWCMPCSSPCTQCRSIINLAVTPRILNTHREVRRGTSRNLAVSQRTRAWSAIANKRKRVLPAHAPCWVCLSYTLALLSGHASRLSSSAQSMLRPGASRPRSGRNSSLPRIRPRASIPDIPCLRLRVFNDH